MDAPGEAAERPLPARSAMLFAMLVRGRPLDRRLAEVAARLSILLASGCGQWGESDGPALTTPEEERPPAKPEVTHHVLRLECEDFEGTWTRQAHLPRHSGTGFGVSGLLGKASSDVMTAVADIPVAGKYSVWARGWEGSGEDRRWQIGVGGTFLAPTHASSNLNDFSWQRAGEVTLPAGPVELTLADAGSYYEVADAIVLATDPEYDPALDESRWLVLDQGFAAGMVLDDIVARAQSYAAAIPTPSSEAQWTERAKGLRQDVLQALRLDPLPQKTPLQANVLGHTQLEGYRIERVTFESRPGFVVTANVYVPDGAGPFPVVISPVGHWTAGKSHPVVTARGRALASLGFLTLTYDPFGQGERKVPGNSHDESPGLNLSGHTNLSIMVWDSMRALDYVLTRSDADGTRIALTGASGGGLNSLFTSVADPRVHVSAPAVYVTQYEDFLATGATHCSCSHVPAVASFTDMGEIAALFAPRPQLLLDALDDPMFPTQGALKAEGQARTVYELFGAGDALRLQSFPGDHGLPKPMREAIYGFLDHHLLAGADEPLPEPELDELPASVFQCFEGGQVPATSPTVKELAKQWAEAAASALPSPTELEPEKTRSELGALLRRQPDVPVAHHVLGEVVVDGLGATRIEIEVEPGVSVPAHARLSHPGAPIVVLSDGSAAVLAGLELLRAADAAGLNALYVSPRGTGETWWYGWPTFTDGVLLGDPIAGQRAHELLQAARVARSLVGSGVPIGLLAVDEAALPGLFAQAVWQPFDAVAVGPLTSTFLDRFGIGMRLSFHVSHILNVADVPHVASLAAGRPLLLALATSSYEERYPEWASHLKQSAELATELDSSDALGWLGQRLGGEHR